MFEGIAFFIKNGWKYDKKYILWRSLYQLINSMIPIMATVMPKLIIDELMGGQDYKRIFFYVFALIGYTAVASALSEYFSWDGFTRRCKVAAEFDSNFHKHLAEADYSMLESPDYLDMQEKAKKFLYCDWHGFGYLLDCAMNVVGQIFTLIGISAIIVTIDVRMLFLFLILIFMGTAIEKKAKYNAMKLSQSIAKDDRGWQYYASLFADQEYAKEIRMNSMGTWLLGREREFFTRINNNLKKQNDGYIKSGIFRSAFTFIQEAVAYIYLVHCVISGKISIGSFAMYTAAVTSFTLALRRVLDSLIDIKTYDLYYEKLDEYLNMPCAMRAGNKEVPKTGPYKLEFHDVSFRYPGSTKNALENINITIPFGQKLSVVGENGAGKTTFIKLLTRMYQPTNGMILLNGTDINEYDYDQYMGLVASVFQDYKLFSFSITDNVTMGKDVDKERVIETLEYVGLGEKLKKLPNGAGTSVYKKFDENGFEPSGGEGQKIALARALYKDAPIVVLDEPTAAMDPKAEYELYEKFNDMVLGKTAIYISHRLSSARFCDTIAVFENGRITEYGSHEELMELPGGKYKSLYTMQSQFYK